MMNVQSFKNSLFVLFLLLHILPEQQQQQKQTAFFPSDLNRIGKFINNRDDKYYVQDKHVIERERKRKRIDIIK